MEEAWLDGIDADIERALRRLPGDQRRAVALRVVDDASYERISAELACSRTAARIKVSRGLASMRRSLERRASGG